MTKDVSGMMKRSVFYHKGIAMAFVLGIGRSAWFRFRFHYLAF